MKRIISVIFVTALISGCAVQHGPAAINKVMVTKKRDLTDPEKKIIQDSVKAKLKDPDSARFQMPQVNEDGYPETYCGLVNAKNSYGGYTGFKPFLATLTKVDGMVNHSYSMLPSASRYGDQAMYSLCQERGYQL